MCQATAPRYGAPFAVSGRAPRERGTISVGAPGTNRAVRCARLRTPAMGTGSLSGPSGPAGEADKRAAARGDRDAAWPDTGPAVPLPGGSASRQQEKGAPMADPAVRQSAGSARDQSLGVLVSLAVKDVTQLLRYELDLAKLELKADVRRIAIAGALLGIAGFVACLV